jgi:hypothetical protein
LSARLQCSQFLWNCAKIKAVVYRRARGERGLDIAQTIDPNCSMTHSPGKIEYNFRAFIMTFRTQIHKKKFGKNGFHTLQGSMSHRPLTNASSLKITAAYCTLLFHRLLFYISSEKLMAKRKFFAKSTVNLFGEIMNHKEKSSTHFQPQIYPTVKIFNDFNFLYLNLVHIREKDNFFALKVVTKEK